MNIAIVGTRGIPNRYGGFERFAEQISSRLADRGHRVTVYCRKAFTHPDDVYDRRIRRVIVPSLHQKHLDTWVSTKLAALHVAFSDNDVVLLCNVANSPFAYIPRLFGKPVVLNVDGLDRKREKWRGLGAQVLHFCEWMSSFSSNQLVTDARAIHDYYLKKYGSESVVIGYGSEAPESDSSSEGSASDYSFDGFNLEDGRYVLYVSRLEPENNPDLVLRAWRNVAATGRWSWSATIPTSRSTWSSSSRWAMSACASSARSTATAIGPCKGTLRVFSFLPARSAGCIRRSSRRWPQATPCCILTRPRRRDRRRRRDAVRKI